jgi:CubicO group peptidase (beta-lactamase class C family)
MNRREFAKLLGAGGLAAAAGGTALTAGTAALDVAPAAASTVGTTAAEFRKTGFGDSRMASFDAAMKQLMEERNITCGQLAVVRDGKLSFARGYTLDDSLTAVQPTTLFRSASLSKPITAVATMRLAQDEQLSLVDRLPDLVDMTPPPGTTDPPDLDDVYVYQMLRHTGRLWTYGFTYDRTIADSLGVQLPLEREDVIKYGAGRPLATPDAYGYAYSNWGYLLLGQIIENAAAPNGYPSYEAYVQDKVLAPMQIDRMKLGQTFSGDPGAEVPYLSEVDLESVFDNGEPPAEVDAPYGGFNLRNWHGSSAWLTSAVDYVRFMTIMTGTTPVLEPFWADFMHWRPDGNPNPTYYGCGWRVRPYSDGTYNIWHGGAMWGTRTLAVGYRNGVTWAAMFNRWHDYLDDATRAQFGWEVMNDYLVSASSDVSEWPTYDLSPWYFDI